jgi:MFS transporter, FSR family, fosmidomycin resistance protein
VPITAIYLFFVSSGLTSHGINAFLPASIVTVYAYSFEISGVQIGAESVANLYFALVLVAVEPYSCTSGDY